MSIPVIGFFNNKGGVGKTSLVYHLSWMYSDLGLRVIAVDLDPQANLTAAFLDEDRLEDLWPKGDHPQTIYGCIQPLLEGVGDITHPHVEMVSEIPGQLSLFEENSIGLLAGDLQLSQIEDELSDVWPKCLDGNQRAFRVTSAFWRAMQQAGTAYKASIILMDLGPNLGAINRAALIATDYIVVPLSPDLFSLQGLRNLGPMRRRWYQEWQERLSKKPEEMHLKLPSGQMQPAGYVVLQHVVRLDRPVQAYDRWIAQIPGEYRKEVLNDQDNNNVPIASDPNCLALLKHYQSLMPLAQEARKPIFHLKPADGAIGSHMKAVQDVRRDFEKLARIIAQQTHVVIPQ
jgi:chromosome partitioning protein